MIGCLLLSCYKVRALRLSTHWHLPMIRSQRPAWQDGYEGQHLQALQRNALCMMYVFDSIPARIAQNSTASLPCCQVSNGQNCPSTSLCLAIYAQAILDNGLFPALLCMCSEPSPDRQRPVSDGAMTESCPTKPDRLSTWTLANQLDCLSWPIAQLSPAKTVEEPPSLSPLSVAFASPCLATANNSHLQSCRPQI